LDFLGFFFSVGIFDIYEGLVGAWYPAKAAPEGAMVISPERVSIPCFVDLFAEGV